jgi:hypothetical protein
MKPGELTTQAFTELYQKLKKQISDETPLHTKETGVPSAPQEPNVDGQQADIAEANQYLDNWCNHALDGDLTKLATADGKTPWATLQDTRNTMDTAKTDLASAAASLDADWVGDAASDYANYLGQADQQIKDLVGGDRYSIDNTALLLREAYAAAAGLKHDLYALGQAASAAIDSFEDQTAQILLTGTIGVAVLAAGAAATVASGGFAAAILGALASTVGGEVFGSAVSQAQVSGKEPVEIMHAVNGHVQTALNNYDSACTKIIDAMRKHLTDLKSYTHKGMLPEPPVVQPSGTKFTLNSFLPKDAADDTELHDLIGKP